MHLIIGGICLLIGIAVLAKAFKVADDWFSYRPRSKRRNF